MTKLLAAVVFAPRKLATAFLFRSRTTVWAQRGQFSCQYLRRISSHSETTTHFQSTRVDLLVENPFDQCWAADSWSVHAADNDEINGLVRCFNSPAPPTFFALTRALEIVDSPKKLEVFQLFTRMLKRDFHFVIRRTMDGDIAEWRIMSQPDRIAALGPDWELVDVMEDFSSAVQIAHHLLELATVASERHERLDQMTVDTLVDLAIERLYITLGTESRGRSSADAAFAFAMAGVTRPEIYQILSIIAYLEINRMGPRPSLSSRNILQIVEKLAAAGMRGPEVEPVYELAANLLSKKEDRPEPATINALLNARENQGGFGMHSTRSLLWLWRFAARQSKAKFPIDHGNDAATSRKDESEITGVVSLDGDEWVNRFDDPSKPLVVDVGCGMGVSLLGLSGYHHLEDNVSSLAVDYSECNFVGGDLKSLVVGYSNGIATRWGISGTTQFVHQSAEGLLDQIYKKYPGPIALIMIQFPTPFRLATKATEDGNSQLPADATSGFMVTPSLLKKIRAILVGSKKDSHLSRPHLLLQSNCEDVAIAMREMALQAGMVSVEAESPVEALPVGNDLPQRTLEWIKAGGERPIGVEWSSEPLLPRNGQTETEVACMFNEIPVHRCLLTHP